MKRLNMIAYDIVIYLSLFIAFLCAISSVIEPSSALKQEPVIEEIQDEEVIELVVEPQQLFKVDKIGVVQKYIDSIEDQILEDELLTYEMVNSWETYSIKNVKYKKQVTENIYQYEVEVQVTGEQRQFPKNEKMIVSSTKQYTNFIMNVNIQYSDYRNGYLVNSIEIPGEIT